VYYDTKCDFGTFEKKGSTSVLKACIQPSGTHYVSTVCDIGTLGGGSGKKGVNTKCAIEDNKNNVGTEVYYDTKCDFGTFEKKGSTSVLKACIQPSGTHYVSTICDIGTLGGGSGKK